MRLNLASNKAIKYACMYFHYARAIPVNIVGFNVFNNKNEWCGVIIYGKGANYHIGTQYGLKQGECIELVRMALNGKQESTSKALAISLRLIKKYIPMARLVVSYSDRNQGHYGTIYQATNWFYVGDSKVKRTAIINGKRTHTKSIYSKYGTNKVQSLRDIGVNIYYEQDKPKHKYLYAIDKCLIEMCSELSRPYPKKESPEKPEL